MLRWGLKDLPVPLNEAYFVGFGLCRFLKSLCSPLHREPESWSIVVSRIIPNFSHEGEKRGGEGRGRNFFHEGGEGKEGNNRAGWDLGGPFKVGQASKEGSRFLL